MILWMCSPLSPSWTNSAVRLRIPSRPQKSRIGYVVKVFSAMAMMAISTSGLKCNKVMTPYVCCKYATFDSIMFRWSLDGH